MVATLKGRAGGSKLRLNKTIFFPGWLLTGWALVQSHVTLRATAEVNSAAVKQMTHQVVMRVEPKQAHQKETGTWYHMKTGSKKCSQGAKQGEKVKEVLGKTRATRSKDESAGRRSRQGEQLESGLRNKSTDQNGNQGMERGREQLKITGARHRAIGWPGAAASPHGGEHDEVDSPPQTSTKGTA